MLVYKGTQIRSIMRQNARICGGGSNLWILRIPQWVRNIYSPNYMTHLVNIVVHCTWKTVNALRVILASDVVKAFFEAKAGAEAEMNCRCRGEAKAVKAGIEARQEWGSHPEARQGRQRLTPENRNMSSSDTKPVNHTITISAAYNN